MKRAILWALVAAATMAASVYLIVTDDPERFFTVQYGVALVLSFVCGAAISRAWKESQP